MPYSLSKAKGGYYVVNQDTKKKYSKKPIPKKNAEAQMRVLYSVMKK